jgi:hypothetical protein
MTHWWEIGSEDQAGRAARPRAVAYYRHSAQDRQENSIPIQRDQVREWAENNGVDIIKEFADAGKSGLRGQAVSLLVTSPSAGSSEPHESCSCDQDQGPLQHGVACT